jgi:uncharacterized membrane protein YbaN (DUF454 family)
MLLESVGEGTSVGVASRLPRAVGLRWFLGLSEAAGTVPGFEPRSDRLTPSAAHAGVRTDASARVSIACHELAGVVEIHDPRLFRPGHEIFCRALAQAAVENFQAWRADIDLNSSMCRLAFNPGEFDRAELARRTAAAVKAAIPALHEKPRGVARESSPLFDLALASGSLTMAVVGAVLPGIPSLPFLVLSLRHAARLSPQFYRFLRRQTWAAALLDHVENSESVRLLDGRCLPKILLVSAFATAVLLMVHPPLPVVMALECGVMAIVCFREAKALQDGRKVALGPNQSLA